MLWALLLAAPPGRGEIVDRILAVVGNGGASARVITWSAAYEEANYQAFRKGEEPPEWTASDPSGPNGAKEILQNMIDQALIEQALESSPFSPSGEEGIEDPMQLLEKQYPSPEAFRIALGRYHLSESGLAERLRRESLLAQFVDATLRPQAHVTPEQVENYYRNTFVPELGRAGGPAAGGASQEAAIPPLEEVRGRIEEILTEQQMDRLLEQWLAELRRRAKIEILPS